MKTYGCFDREYWNYSSTDVSCARKQEAVLTLALVHGLDVPQNPFFDNAGVVSYIDAALGYWCHIQLSDGSFNDLYPYERSFVATAFSAYAVSEALLQLRNTGTAARLRNADLAVASLRRAGNWITRKVQTPVCNQICGSIAFLQNLYLLTGDAHYLSDIAEKLQTLQHLQTSEGWMPEYGGFDVGYTSVAVDYLGKYYERSGDPCVLAIAGKLCDFLAEFVHPDASFGGEYGSRSTQYMLPHGFAVFAPQIPSASWLNHAVQRSLAAGQDVIPFSVDDKYLLFNGYTFLQAHLTTARAIKQPATYARPSQRARYFEGCKIYVHENDAFSLVVNGAKGGALHLYLKPQQKTVIDSGVLAETVNRRRFVTLGLDPRNRVTVSQDAAITCILIEGSMRKPFDNQLTLLRNLALRGFQATFGRWPALSHLIKESLRRALITRRGSSPHRFRRTIKVDATSVEISDELHIAASLRSLVTLAPLDSIYGESSRYFAKPQLETEMIVLNAPKPQQDGVYRVHQRFEAQ